MSFKAKTARKLTDRIKDPKNLKEIYAHIKNMAMVGFANTQVQFEDELRANHFAEKLREEGYDAYVWANSSFSGVVLEIEW